MNSAAVATFASDNCAGAHPEVVAAVAAASTGSQRSYGADDYTSRLQEVFRAEFGPGARTYPVFNGTGANVLALQAMTSRWGAVIPPYESVDLKTKLIYPGP